MIRPAMRLNYATIRLAKVWCLTQIEKYTLILTTMCAKLQTKERAHLFPQISEMALLLHCHPLTRIHAVPLQCLDTGSRRDRSPVTYHIRLSSDVPGQSRRQLSNPHRFSYVTRYARSQDPIDLHKCSLYGWQQALFVRNWRCRHRLYRCCRHCWCCYCLLSAIHCNPDHRRCGRHSGSAMPTSHPTVGGCRPRLGVEH